MHKALLISNKNFLEDIYRANLVSYLNIMMDYCHEPATLTAQKRDIYQIIIVQDGLLNDGLQQWIKQCQDNIPTLLLVQIGGNKAHDKNWNWLADIYDVKSLLRTIAQHFNITAKQMALVAVEDYVPMPISLFRGFEQAPCDLYHATTTPGGGTQYQLLAKSKTPLEELLKSQLENGQKTFYVPKLERLQVVSQSTQQLIARLSNVQSSNEEKLDNLETGMMLVGEHLRLNKGADVSIQQLGNACVEEMRNVIKRLPSLTMLISLLLKNKTHFIFAHSMLAAHVSQFLIGRMPWGAKGQAEKLTYAFFFHDIWLAPLLNKYPLISSEDEMLFKDDLSDKEKNILLQHARLAHDLVLNLPDTPVGAETIILQHHGSRGGKDFASDFPDFLTPLAKVAIVAHAFSEEYLGRINSDPDGDRTIDRAEIIAELMQRFTRPTYQKIVESLTQLTI